MIIDSEVSLKSLLIVAKSLEQLIGQHGAQAVLRSAGQQASANLIEMLPLKLSEEDAVNRSGMLLIELGFLRKLEITDTGDLKISGNLVLELIQDLGLAGNQSMRFYVVGLFEGFFQQMSGSKKRVIAVQSRQEYEVWRLE